jgi:hypothetical protein
MSKSKEIGAETVSSSKGGRFKSTQQVDRADVDTGVPKMWFAKNSRFCRVGAHRSSIIEPQIERGGFHYKPTFKR